MNVISTIPMSFDAYQWDGTDDTLDFLKERLGCPIAVEKSGNLVAQLNPMNPIEIEKGDWVTIDNRGCVYAIDQCDFSRMIHWNSRPFIISQMSREEVMQDDNLF
jgi:hypothetical protein